MLIKLYVLFFIAFSITLDIYASSETKLDKNIQSRIDKFYKEDIGYSYFLRAARLITDVANIDQKRAVEIFEHSIRRHKNPNVNFDTERSLLNYIAQCCGNLKECRVYYECLMKCKKNSVGRINSFLETIQYVTCVRYKQLNNNDRSLSAIKELFKEYEDIFKDSNIIIAYKCLFPLTFLHPKQLHELIKYRESLKEKSKIALQLNVILQAYLEMKQNKKISPETVAEMWAYIKDLPEVWKTALGLSMLTFEGCEDVAPFLVAPVLKIATDRVWLVVNNLAIINDDAIIKKVASPLIKYCMLQLKEKKTLKFDRITTVSISHLLSLAYRSDNKRTIKELLCDFKMAEYSDIYIVLANLGAIELIKTSFDKNWQNLNYYPLVKLFPEGLACAEKMYEKIKNPEKRYVVKTLFAAPFLYKKDKNGRINYKNYDVQSMVRKKLAEEFEKIKFSRKQSKIFCLLILLKNKSEIEILAKNSSSRILVIKLDDILDVEDYYFHNRIGQFYFKSLLYGNGKAVIEKFNHIIKSYKHTSRKERMKMGSIIEGCIDAYRSFDMRKIKYEQIEELATLGQLLYSRRKTDGKFLQLVAFFSYLSGEQKSLIDLLKNIPADKIPVNVAAWGYNMRYINTFCNNNKLTQREISGFINSPLVEKIFKNKSEQLKNVKTFLGYRLK